MRNLLSATILLLAICATSHLAAEEPASPKETLDTLDGAEGRELLLKNFRPRGMLKVKQTDVARAKFPAIDVHTHFRYRFRHSPEQLAAFVELMDRNNIAVCVSLDGQLGDDFREHAAYLWTNYPNRFMIFANIDWQGDGQADDPATWACHRPGFAERTAERLAEAKELGACGLKLFKQFGLGHRNPDGSLIEIDDPRWDPIWEACGRLGLPVIIHTADPAAFFLDIDATNERWEELHRHPEWSFPADKFPSRDKLLGARNRVIGRHPQTTFIGAHVANNPEDLAVVSEWLAKYPNLHVGFASRIGELGRQPYTARRFFLDHADRILFTTDGPWPEQRVRLYWRFLETFDEYFPYSEKEFPPQGFWNIYGIGLPDDVLRKVYHENALRIIPGLAAKFSAATANK
jgi:predicted TIM-barrel fold metal-dependent hydrolase